MEGKRKKKVKPKVSQQKENTSVKQSPDKTKNEAEHFQNQETDSTSRPSKCETEKTVSSSSSTTSTISEFVDILSRDILERTIDNLNGWKDDERSKSETDDNEDESPVARRNKMVKQQLKKFYDLRRVFAEHQEETPEEMPEETTEETPKEANSATTSKDIDPREDSCETASTVSTQKTSAGKRIKNIYKMSKSAVKRWFRSKPGKKNPLAKEQDLDDADMSESDDTKSLSPCPEDASPTASIGWTENNCASDQADFSSVPLELVGNVEHENVKSEAEKVPQDLVPDMDSSDCASPKGMSPTASIVSSENIKAAEEAHLSFDPLELVDHVEQKIITPETEKIPLNLVTDMDATPGPSLELPGAERLDEAVGSPSSVTTSKDTNLPKPGSPFPGEVSSVEMDAPSQEDDKDDKDDCKTGEIVSTQKTCDSKRTYEKSTGKRINSIYKMSKSAVKRWFRSKPGKKKPLVKEQDLDDADMSESDDTKSVSPCPEDASQTASIGSTENISASDQADFSSVPLELVGNVEHENVKSEAEKVPQDLVPDMDSSDCASPKGMSPTASIVSSENIKTVEEAHLSFDPLELVDDVEQKMITPETEKLPHNLVTDMDATPGPSLELPGAERLDEAVGSASSVTTSKDTNLPKPGSPFPGEVSSVEMDAPSQEDDKDDKDDCKTGEIVSTQKTCDSKRTYEKSTGKRINSIYKMSKSAVKRWFRSKPGKKNPLAKEQDLDDADMSESDDTKSVSPCPEDASQTASIGSTENISASDQADFSSVPLELVGNVEHENVKSEAEKVPQDLVPDMDSSDCASPKGMSPTASIVSSDNIKTVEEAHLSFDPLELVDDVEQEIITPETEKIPQVTQVPIVTPEAEKVPQDLVPDMDSSDCASPKGMSPTASIVSSENIKAAEEAHLSFDPLELVDDVEQEIITPETEKIPQVTQVPIVTPEAEKVPQDLVPDMDSSDCASPKGMSPTASIDFSVSIEAAEKADPSFDSQEQMDVEDEDVTPEGDEVIALKPSTRSSSPPAGHYTESSSEKDLVMSDSTPGTSEQDRHPEGSKEDNEAAVLAQFNGLKKTVYNIIKRFFDCLTEEQRTEISKGVYNTDVKEKLGGMCVELLRLAIDKITDTVSQAMNQPAPRHGTLTKRNPTSSQKLPAETQSELAVIMEHGLQQSLEGIFGQAYSEVIADTSVIPKLTTNLVVVITAEANAVLSETTQDSSSVRSATCCMFLCCRACRKMMVVRVIKSLLTQFKTKKHSDCETKDDRSTDEHTTQAHQKKGPWGSGILKRCKNKVHPVSDEQKNSISSDELIFSGRSTKVHTPLKLVDYDDDTSDDDTSEDDENNTPSRVIVKEDEVIVPDNRESPIPSEKQTEDQKEDPKKPSLLRRIWLFCCRRRRSNE